MSLISRVLARADIVWRGAHMFHPACGPVRGSSMWYLPARKDPAA
jgi:hypothetical protein